MRRGAFLFAAALIPATPAAAEPEQAYVSAVDYPPDVRPGPDFYQVRVRYAVQPDGRVGDCTVIQSSDQPSLDVESCRLLQTRGRFRPRRAAATEERAFFWGDTSPWPISRNRGDPIQLGLFFRVNDYPMASIARREQGLVQYRLEVSPLGRPTRCTVTASSGSARLDQRACQVLIERGFYLPSLAGDQFVTGVVNGVVNWRLPN